jgi:hypothetical protein
MTTQPILSRLMWHVMNSTADDWESLAQIVPDVNRSLGPHEQDSVEETVRIAFANGYILAKTGDWQPAASLDQEITSYWFSMSEAGRKVWESETETYWSGNPPNQSTDPAP